MDIRIVNTCNNNCIYCLEQSYRLKRKYIPKDVIYRKIIKNKLDSITFYWWNPILHPDLDEIISFCSSVWYNSIWILTNTNSLNIKKLKDLISKWLNSVWFYFNSFDEEKHDFIVNWWIKLDELLNNIKILKNSWIFLKAIIHINKQNIENLFRDIFILNKKYWIKNIEFINYFPFDRPYEKFDNILKYSYSKNRIYIQKLFKVINKLNLEINFKKFDKNFFWDNLEFYDYKNWILNQIWVEDKKRFLSNSPFCFIDKRCMSCFIKDNCKYYEWK